MVGILNFYKEKGISSFNAINRIKKLGQIKKIGHAGTLDPNAEGLLPVLVGKATRLNDIFLNFDKAYTFELVFGKETDSHDIWGNITYEKDYSNVSHDALLRALEGFKGKIDQVPPMYSALKRDGVPLYKLARKGIELELASRQVEIYGLDLLDYKEGWAKMHVKCSKGTYIRSLCRDIGRALDTYATMSALIRTDYGPFNLKDSKRLEEISSNLEDFLEPIDLILKDYPRIDLDDDEKERFIQGKRVFVRPNIEGDIIRVYHKGKIFGLCKREDYEGMSILKSWKYFGE